jgi:hypothetical protein
MNRLVTKNQKQSSECWYTRREGVIRGPFSAEDVTRYILLGRIRLDDELSQERENWVAAAQLTSLLPAELSSQSGWEDYERLVTAHMKVDERKGDRRHRKLRHYHDANRERRTSPERRDPGASNPLLSHYLYVRMMSAQEKRRKAPRLRPVLMMVLLATLMFVWLGPIQT